MKMYCLDEICEIGSSKRIYMKDYVENGIPFYRSKEIIKRFKGETITETLYISEEKFNEIKRKYGVPKEGDILLTSVGTLGVPYLVQAGDKFYFKDGNLTWFKNFKPDVLSHYIYYWIQSEIGQKAINSISIGTTQKALTIDSLKKLHISLPSIEQQRSIVEILGSLDDKIELNRRMNETLEQMAMALYKHWFVDFGPFQDGEFEESELGPIPKGWTIKKLSTLVETQYGYTESASTEKVGPHFLRGTDINKTTHIDWTTVPYCKISQEDYEKYKLLPGDIVVIRMADPGKPAIVEQDVDAVFASYLVRLKIKKGSGLLPYYLFYFLLSDRYQNYIGGASNGTTRKSANAKVLTDIDIIIPDVDTIRLFEEKVGQLRRQITLNIQEINTLSELRDYLLPRLLSGEIEVREAEEQVEEVLANA